MMKKYLMTGLVAVALSGLFSSCSKDIETGEENTVEFNILQTYEDAFVTRFGQPAENQNWGFGNGVGSTRYNNPGEDVPYTSDAINANANEWADATPGKTYGGWVVPDPLTRTQKDVVRAYFQANPNLRNEDPHWRHFFVQQVYKGHTDPPTTGNKEVTTAANGTSTYTSDNMNLLTVGHDEQHLNDFNNGTRSWKGVLDKDYTANDYEGHHHSDQISLMVNIDDTSCFGYHNSGNSIQRNDKWALVGWETIRTWANNNGLDGDCLADGWNRSFMGFDFELLPESDIVLDSYALLSQVPSINDIHYAWDGQKVMGLGEAPVSVGSKTNIELKSFERTWYGDRALVVNNNLVCKIEGYQSALSEFSNADWSSYDKLVVKFAAAPDNDLIIRIAATSGQIEQTVQAGSTEAEIAFSTGVPTGVSSIQLAAGANAVNCSISEIYIEGNAPSVEYYNPTYLLGDDDADKISFYSNNTNMYGGIVRNLTEDEMKTTRNGKTCLDLTLFQGLVADGYHPITSDLKTWVKWQAACDGYYSDWIVTLTKAERIGTPTPPVNPPTYPTNFVCRIIAEDLTIGERSDFDFNDVVFDVLCDGSTTTIRLRAAGGELPLYVAGQEVHQAFSTKYPGITSTTLVNTGWKGSTLDYDNYYVDFTIGGVYNDVSSCNNIPVVVTKKGRNDELIDIELTARTGKVASKVCVGSDYKWCSERQDIDEKYHLEGGVLLFHEYVKDHYGGEWWNNNAWYQQLGQ